MQATLLFFLAFAWIGAHRTQFIWSVSYKESIEGKLGNLPCTLIDTSVIISVCEPLN